MGGDLAGGCHGLRQTKKEGRMAFLFLFLSAPPLGDLIRTPQSACTQGNACGGEPRLHGGSGLPGRGGLLGLLLNAVVSMDMQHKIAPFSHWMFPDFTIDPTQTQQKRPKPRARQGGGGPHFLHKTEKNVRLGHIIFRTLWYNEMNTVCRRRGERPCGGAAVADFPANWGNF